jgi:hypothetical protein
VKKSKYSPLTLPSPARGEGKQIEIEKKSPPLDEEGTGWEI